MAIAAGRQRFTTIGVTGIDSSPLGALSVAYFAEPVRAEPHGPAPLIVITTNEEKELPAAFLRRCLVLGLSLPPDAELAPFLIGRGRAHFDGMVSDAVLAEAARQVVEERRQIERDAPVRPGQAEYLDILRAVIELVGPLPAPKARQRTEVERDQRGELDKIARYCLKKSASIP